MTSSSCRKYEWFRSWAVVAAWLACSIPPSVATGEPSTGFTPSSCPFDTAPLGRVECGHVTVPQDRAEPDGRRLRLAVAVLRATGSTPAGEPLVFLSGGPGEPILRYLSQLDGSRFFRAAREGRDLVFFDQRGTGASEPTFCEGLERVLAYDGLVAPPRDELLDRQLRALTECRLKLAADGIDVADFNSTNAAHDVRDILDALGYQRVDLYGHSYGSRLALAVIREHPGILRSVLMSGPYPPDVPTSSSIPGFARASGTVSRACADNDACAAEFPDLEAQLHALLRELEERPIRIAMPVSERFPDGGIVIDGRRIGDGIQQGLYDNRFVPLLPMLVREARARNDAVLALLAGALVPEPGELSQGLYHAVECYDRRALSTVEEWVATGRRHAALEPWHRAAQEAPAWHRLCEAWQPGRARPQEFQPVASDVPTLIVAGEFDPVTPPEFASRIQQGLRRAQVLIVPGFGHLRLLSGSDCTSALALAFLHSPETQLDTSCLAELPPIQFVTDLRGIPGLARLTLQAQRGDWSRIGPLAAIGLLLLSVLVVWPVSAWRARRAEGAVAAASGEPLRLARWAVGLAAIIAVLFGVALAVAAMSAIRQSPFLLMFGLPREFDALFLLPWLTGALGLIGLITLSVAWRRSAVPVRKSIYWAATALSALAFPALLAGIGIR